MRRVQRPTSLPPHPARALTLIRLISHRSRGARGERERVQRNPPGRPGADAAARRGSCLERTASASEPGEPGGGRGEGAHLEAGKRQWPSFRVRGLPADCQCRQDRLEVVPHPLQPLPFY
jgi:hypothetical protein